MLTGACLGTMQSYQSYLITDILADMNANNKQVKSTGETNIYCLFWNSVTIL